MQSHSSTLDQVLQEFLFGFRIQRGVTLLCKGRSEVNPLWEHVARTLHSAAFSLGGVCAQGTPGLGKGWIKGPCYGRGEFPEEGLSLLFSSPKLRWRGCLLFWFLPSVIQRWYLAVSPDSDTSLSSRRTSQRDKLQQTKHLFFFCVLKPHKPANKPDIFLCQRIKRKLFIFIMTKPYWGEQDVRSLSSDILRE